MNKNTQKITTGALMIAIFGMILFINRQTGYFFEEMMMYVLPIPMVAFSVKYGWKDGIPVCIGMTLISILFGTPTTIFYAGSESLIGLVLGTCLYKKMDANKTIVLVVLLSTIVNLLNTVVLASLFGYDLSMQVAEMQDMYMQVMKTSGMEMPQEILDTFLNPVFLMRMIVITMAFAGMLQGYIIYVLSIMILKKLRYQLPEPKSIYTFYPPKALGVIMALLVLMYGYTNVQPMKSDILQTLIQSAGIASMMFLIFFGFLGMVLLSKAYTRRKGIGVLLGLIFCFTFTPFMMCLGIVYAVTDFHRGMCEKIAENEQMQKKEREVPIQPRSAGINRYRNIPLSEIDFTQQSVEDVKNMQDVEKFQDQNIAAADELDAENLQEQEIPEQKNVKEENRSRLEGDIVEDL